MIHIEKNNKQNDSYNGFLLIEQLYQDWDGSDWVDDSKYTYTYDGNNNMIEWLIKW